MSQKPLLTRGTRKIDCPRCNKPKSLVLQGHFLIQDEAEINGKQIKKWDPVNLKMALCSEGCGIDRYAEEKSNQMTLAADMRELLSGKKTNGDNFVIYKLHMKISVIVEVPEDQDHEKVVTLAKQQIRDGKFLFSSVKINRIGEDGGER